MISSEISFRQHILPFRTAARIVAFSVLVILSAVPAFAAPSGTARPEPAAKTLPAAQEAPPAQPSKFKGAEIRRETPAAADPARARGTQKTNTGFDFRRVAGALAAVIGLIFVLRWVAKKYFAVPGAGGRDLRAVKLLSRSPLAPKQHVLLLHVGNRIIVTADCGGQLSTLAEISDPDEVAILVGQARQETVKAGASFGSLFSSVKDGFDTAFARHRGGRISDGEPEGEIERNENASTDETADEPADPAIEATKTELNGLMDKVRVLARQFKAS